MPTFLPDARVYAMAFVTGWPEIAAVFGVKQKTVKAWYVMGAPILCLGEKPVTETGDLWAWLLDHRQEVEQGER